MTPSPPTSPPSRRSALIPAALGLGVLVLAMTVVYQLGRLHHLRSRLAEARRALEAARQANTRLEQRLRAAEAARQQLALELGRRARPATTSPASSPAPHRPASKPTPATQPAAAPLDEAHLLAQLNVLLRPSGDQFVIADRPAARRLMELVRSRSGSLKLGPLTWTRLALLAALLDDPLADALAERAEQAGADRELRPVWRLRARAALARRAFADALKWTGRLMQAGSADDRDRLLAALAAAGSGDWRAAAAAFESIDPQRLDPQARVAYGRLCVALERWDALDRVLATLRPTTTQPSAGLTFLRAAALIHDGQADRGRALIETLLSHDPDNYELRVWRAIALIEARQYAAAREALRFAEQYPDRPEAWYWRAMVEIRSGNEDAAAAFLSEALAASQQYAPAWEALGVLALNRDDLSAAIDYLTQAVRTGPWRASAHLLLAIAYARAGRHDDALRSLRTAVRLDPSLADKARQAPALRAILTRDELESLAPASRPADSP